MNINIKIDSAFNIRRKKLGKKWREVIYTGLNALEKAIPDTPPEEEYRTLLKRLYELYKKKE